MNGSCPVCKSRRLRLERELNNCRLLKCLGCDFVFAPAAKDFLHEINVGYKYNDEFSFIKDLWFDYLIKKQIGRVVNVRGKVLDIGCGDGRLLRRFVDMGWDCWGVDISENAACYAKKYGYRFMNGDFESMEIEADSFDLVVSTSTLEHVYDPSSFIAKVLTVLKSGGYAFLAGIPNYASIAVRTGTSKFYHNMPPAHVNYFTPRTLYNLVRRKCAGRVLDFLDIKTYGFPEAFYISDRLKNLKNRLLEKKKRSRLSKGKNGEKKKRDVLLKSKFQGKGGDKYGKYSKYSMCYRALIYLYFVSGVFFYAGDKILLIMRKR